MTTGLPALDALINWEALPPGTGLVSAVPAAEYPTGLPTVDQVLRRVYERCTAEYGPGGQP